MDKKMSKLFAEEEAMRCLLCYDAPCSRVCPAQTNPAKFIRSIRFKNYLGGINTIRKNNVFGASCSELCNGEMYCEKACIRNKIDKPISIQYLQKFLMEMEEVKKEKKLMGNPKGLIAILGGDVKAYSAAYEFIERGYEVTLYSSKSIVEYFVDEINESVLSEKMLKNDIQNILNNGLHVKAYIPSIDDISGKPYRAILFASEDVYHISFSHKGLSSKSYYLDKLVKGPDDIVFSIKQGREAAKKVIREIE